MDAVQIDILRLSITALAAILAAAISVVTTLPSRSKLLKDFEILDKALELRLTKEEKTYVLMIRSSIGRQLRELAVPRKKYAAVAILVSAIVISIYMTLQLGPLRNFTGDPVSSTLIWAVLAWPVGYFSGALPMKAAMKLTERRLEQTNEFLKAFSREIEDRIPEGGKDKAEEDKPEHERPDESEDIS